MDVPTTATGPGPAPGPTPELLPAGIAETHSAVVVFLGDRAYKIKKPVDLGFLDFSTPEARAEACENEVELNRRLSPDVYLGVAEIGDTEGGVCDHMVVMRRLPEDRKLRACLDRGEDVTDAIRAVARDVAVLHGRATTGPSHTYCAEPAAVRRNWTDGFAQMAPFVGELLDPDVQARIEQLALRFLDGRGPLLERRISRGHVRDGHGDLQAEDIFLLDDGPRILDCLDFDAGLRWGDVLLDVGFLAMDLERLGHPDVAARFLADYREFSAENWSASLADHYIAYRAHVRAKVATLRAAQTGERTDDIAQLQRLCLEHLERARIRLVVVGGLPGTGKSTVAAALGNRAGAVVLRTDEIRNQMTSGALVSTADRYSPVGVDAVYQETLCRAERLLRRGEQVVIDATWSSSAHRDEVRAVAERNGADLVEIECHAPQAVCDQRIRERLDLGTDPSEATPEVAAAMAARFAPWPEATAVSTTTPLELTIDQAALAAGWESL
ncbi:MAG TPA: AAA family ATPase [Microthrixaceae bacterium]|nr:AAA family ATPase [Microthrixaceae bacterium]